MEYLTKLTGNRFYSSEVEIDNIASQNLMKKLGGYPDGISEFLLHGEALDNFQKENHHLIDDNLVALADEFCMEPEDLLGCVVRYRFDTESLK